MGTLCDRRKLCLLTCRRSGQKMERTTSMSLLPKILRWPARPRPCQGAVRARRARRQLARPRLPDAQGGHCEHCRPLPATLLRCQSKSNGHRQDHHRILKQAAHSPLIRQSPLLHSTIHFIRAGQRHSTLVAIWPTHSWRRVWLQVVHHHRASSKSLHLPLVGDTTMVFRCLVV